MWRLRPLLLCTCALTAALIALLFAFPTDADAQSGDEIQKHIGSWRAEYEPSIFQRLTAYYETNRVHWQGIATHTEAAKPAYEAHDKEQPIPDEKSFAADCLGCKPTDQLAAPSFSELFPELIDKLPASLEVHIYSGPSGDGFVLIYEYCVEGSCHRLEVNNGPEDWRNSDWTEQKVDQ